MGKIADELIERSKFDNAMIVGSEIRSAIDELKQELEDYKISMQPDTYFSVRVDNFSEAVSALRQGEEYRRNFKRSMTHAIVDFELFDKMLDSIEFLIHLNQKKEKQLRSCDSCSLNQFNECENDQTCWKNLALSALAAEMNSKNFNI